MKDDYKNDYKKMFKALKHALYHPTNGLVFIAQVVRHGSGPALKHTYHKMLQTKEGGEVAFGLEEISTYLPDLVNRPEGSVGRECYKTFQEHQINVVKVSRKKSNDKWIEAKHPYSWMARRFRDTHDIWHVLTGYPTSIDGEMCLTMFSFAQTRALSWLTISLTILFAIGRKNRLELLTLSRIKMILEAYKNGKKAKFLLAEDYDKLLSENLQDARERLNIRSPRFFIDKSPNLLKL
jgi:ubiquinone biosynthesis protein COQ4